MRTYPWRFFKVASLALILSLSGCVTTQGGGAFSPPKLQPLNFDLATLSAGLGDVLSPQLREFKGLVSESKFDEADAYFIKESNYFEKRFHESQTPLPLEFTKLAEHVWQTRYQAKTASAISGLQVINDLTDKSTWPQASKALKDGNLVIEAISSDKLLNMTNVAASQKRAVEQQVVRLTQLTNRSKSKALENTFLGSLASGQYVTGYVGKDTFNESDYKNSSTFQALAVAKLSTYGDQDLYKKEAVKIGPYLSTQSRNTVDQAYAELVRKQLFSDGQISLDEVSSLGKVRTPFGGGGEAISSLVTIGYIDLTSASFKNRNIFDFEIAFKQDLDFKFAPATEAVFVSGDLKKYDFLFVTDLTMAKVAREFKSKKEVKSRAQTGTEQIQNPSYITAMAEYQKAMSEFQRAQISSATPKACSGWGCVLTAIADGMDKAGARSNVDRASAQLGSTSQTIGRPVYSEYSYQSVDVSTTKTADVNYYVIDVKKKRILKNNFQINDNEVFNVAYNLRDEDPDKSSIQRNLKTEDEVTNWEKRAMPLNISLLFTPENLRTATATPYTDISSFLKTLNTRVYAPAAPTYVRNSESRTMASSASTPNHSDASQTIADERFDSVVIIRVGKNTGTGFYVTPELVLTAYHVVQGNSLVEMTYYDGTKTYGKVVDHDIRLDLALIKAQQTGKPLAIHTGPLKLGETVEAIGHPKNYEFTITRGVISAVRRQRSAAIGSDNLVEFIQTDTPISPGNSGGPLLLKNSVIGVNDWIRVDKGSQNLNFSVSHKEISAYLTRFQGK